MTDKSRWQQEFDALPEWAKKMVRALAGSPGYGSAATEYPFENYAMARVFLREDASEEWWDGFDEMVDLADALTAPWPPPIPEPHEKMTTSNIVEMMALGDDDEECAFDQPCHFGHRIGGHAVYCHNDAWPDSPRKCRRNRTDFLHEDCPGFVANLVDERESA